MLSVMNGKWVNAFVPIDTTGAGQDGDWISLKNYDGVAIILGTGAWAGGAAAVTIEQATDVAGTGAKALAFTTRYADGDVTASDALVATAVAGNTFNLAAANTLNVIEVKASDLDQVNNFDCIRVRSATPGANADLVYGLYYLYGGRYCPQGTPPSAIVD